MRRRGALRLPGSRRTSPVWPPHRLARTTVIGLGLARLVEGIYATVTTTDLLARLGAQLPDPGAQAGFRMKAGRDIALGLLTLTAVDDDHRLAQLAATAVVVDAVDGVTMVRYGRSVFGQGPVAPVGAAMGFAVAAAAGWAAHELRR